MVDDLVYRPQRDPSTYADDLVYRPWLDQNPDPVLLGNSNQPIWNPDGVLGGIADLNPPYNSLDMLMTPEEQATIAPMDGTAGGIDGIPDLRPPNWDSNDNTPSTISLGEGSAPDLTHPVVVQPAGGDSGDNQESGPRTPVGPVPGYPETGKNSWRAGLDDQITTSADQFNTDNGYKPGDPLYMTPQTLKSWIMQESGGSQKAFQSDPLQANNSGDWDNAKANVGLTRGQQMTPEASINGGLDWFRLKANHLANQSPSGEVSMSDALKAYNGNTKTDPNGLPHNQNYANAILSRVGNGN